MHSLRPIGSPSRSTFPKYGVFGYFGLAGIELAENPTFRELHFADVWLWQTVLLVNHLQSSDGVEE